MLMKKYMPTTYSKNISFKSTRALLVANDGTVGENGPVILFEMPPYYAI
jgi:hypothetical protein